jgi:hypothetical protein
MRDNPKLFSRVKFATILFLVAINPFICLGQTLLVAKNLYLPVPNNALGILWLPFGIALISLIILLITSSISRTRKLLLVITILMALSVCAISSIYAFSWPYQVGIFQWNNHRYYVTRQKDLGIYIVGRLYGLDVYTYNLFDCGVNTLLCSQVPYNESQAGSLPQNNYGPSYLEFTGPMETYEYDVSTSDGKKIYSYSELTQYQQCFVSDCHAINP